MAGIHLSPLRVLIAVATAPEAEALSGLDVEVVVCGVGPVAAALGTQAALLGGTFDLAVSVGIGGAYPGSGLAPGDLAVSSTVIHADLGAWDGARWLGLDALGLSVEPGGGHFGQFAVWDGAAALAAQVGAAFGPLLTLSSVTGSLDDALALAARHPGALTEGMEGAGVAHAALRCGVPVVELRGVSNAVGPRDRSAWRIGEALAAVRRGVAGLL